jgi:hypothetical protein
VRIDHLFLAIAVTSVPYPFRPQMAKVHLSAWLLSAFQPAKDDLASAVATAMRLKRVFSQEQGYWSDAEVVPG